MFLDKVKVGDFYFVSSLQIILMLMDSSRPVQSKPSFLLDRASWLLFDENEIMECRGQAFGAHPDLALTWSQAGHALRFHSLRINLVAQDGAKWPNPALQKSQFHMAPQLAHSFKCLKAGGEFLLNKAIYLSKTAPTEFYHLPYVSVILILLIDQDRKVKFHFNVKKIVKMFLGIFF